MLEDALLVDKLLSGETSNSDHGKTAVVELLCGLLEKLGSVGRLEAKGVESAQY